MHDTCACMNDAGTHGVCMYVHVCMMHVHIMHVCKMQVHEACMYDACMCDACNKKGQTDGRTNGRTESLILGVGLQHVCVLILFFLHYQTGIKCPTD